MPNVDYDYEAQKIWKALRPLVDERIKTLSKSCVRARKMIVTRDPDGSTVGVQEPFGQELNVPYSSALNLSVGDSVWVYWYAGSASNMIVMTMGDGQLSNP